MAPKLSEVELNVLAMSWQCFKTPNPEVRFLSSLAIPLFPQHHYSNQALRSPEKTDIALSKIDFDRLAKLLGHSNTGSTRNSLYAIKKKLAAMADGNGNLSETADMNNNSAASTPGKGTPKPKAGRKRKAKDDVDAVKTEPTSDGESTPSPKKKRTATPKKNGKIASSDETTSEGEKDASTGEDPV